MRGHVFIGPVALIALWGFVSVTKLIDPFFLPSPVSTFRELIRFFTANVITLDLLTTLWRILLSFITAAVFGLPLGFLLGSSVSAYKIFELVVDFCRSIAPLAVFPLFLIIFGIGDASKIAVASFSAGFVILFNVAYGVIHSKKSRIRAVRIMGANKLQVFQSVLFWEILPQTFAGLRTALGWIIGVIIATEMFVGTNLGLGHKILDFQITYNLPGVYASIILVGLTGYLVNLSIVLLEKKVLHWTHKA